MVTDLNASVGTVSRDSGRHVGYAGVQATFANPTYVNDGNSTTKAVIETGSDGTWYEYIKSDLGSAYRISSFNIYAANGPSMLDAFEYSTDGTTWHAIGLTESGGRSSGPDGATLTFTAAIDARYWACRASATGFHPTLEFNTWKINGITIPSALVCNFSGTPTSGPPTLAVTFTDLSTGTPTSWAWNFGDGGTSTSQNPSHSYTTAGSYTVTLTIIRSGDGATDFATKVFYVVVTGPGVYMDWDGDGFGSGTYDNVTSYAMSWSITRGAAAEITGASQPGSATLILKNTNDIFNPYNTLSPLYGKLHDGVPVWIGVTDDGKVTGATANGLFGGRITDITVIPSPGTTDPATVEIVCEDALGWYQRLPVELDYAEGRSYAALRAAALVEAGETRYSLAHEIQTMPLSHAEGSLQSTLDSINAVTGTRHYILPADLYTDWYSYVTRNRQYGLTGTPTVTLSASSDHVTGSDGWRLSADTVINQQKATVQPVVFTPGTFTVWQADQLPITVTPTAPYVRTVSFDDVVSHAVLNLASTGSVMVSTLTPFATAAIISLTVASGSTTVTALSIEGRLARRLEQQSYVSNDTTSQAVSARGVRAGSEIGNEYMGVMAEAVGIARHITNRYGSPQLRPTLTVENWFPEMVQTDLYETIGLTSTHLSMDARIFEIVGLTLDCDLAASAVVHHTARYVLQECAVQSDPHYFVIGTSLLGGTDVLAP